MFFLEKVPPGQHSQVPPNLIPPTSEYLAVSPGDTIVAKTETSGLAWEKKGLVSKVMVRYVKKNYLALTLRSGNDPDRILPEKRDFPGGVRTDYLLASGGWG